jgi:hypothetical protein
LLLKIIIILRNFNNFLKTQLSCSLYNKKVRFALGDMSYEFDVKPSRYFPTVESMFKVYLGMHNRSIINSYNISPAERYSVSKIIIVIFI